MTREQWLAKRMGNITGSKVSALFTEPKLKADKEAGNLSETAKSYLDEKICELLTGYQEEGFTTKEMQWGIDHEPYAVEELKEKGIEFNYHGVDNPVYFPYGEFSGCSPDGEKENIVYEIKCPFKSAIHLKNLRLKTQFDLLDLNKDYYYQVQFNMLCVSKVKEISFDEMQGRFISFDPRFRKEHRLKILNISPDLDFLKVIDKKLLQAENYMRNEIKYFIQ